MKKLLLPALLMSTLASANCVDLISNQIKTMQSELDKTPFKTKFNGGGKYQFAASAASTAVFAGIPAGLVASTTVYGIDKLVGDEKISDMIHAKRQAGFVLDFLRQAQSGGGELVEHQFVKVEYQFIKLALKDEYKDLSFEEFTQNITTLSDREEVCSVDGFDSISEIAQKAADL